jgi:hypothetical protein
MKEQEYLEKLHDDIAYEQSMYETSCNHPTDTAQFWSVLERHRMKIENMKEDYAKLVEEGTV